MSNREKSTKNLARIASGELLKAPQSPALLPRGTRDAPTQSQQAERAYDGGCDEHVIALLARQAHVPLEYVGQLYTRELTALAVGARITGFLPILALKKVRERLCQGGQTASPPVRAVLQHGTESASV